MLVSLQLSVTTVLGDSIPFTLWASAHIQHARTGTHMYIRVKLMNSFQRETVMIIKTNPLFSVATPTPTLLLAFGMAQLPAPQSLWI